MENIRTAEDLKRSCIWIVVEDVAEALNVKWEDLFYPHIGKDGVNRYWSERNQVHVVNDTVLVAALTFIPGKPAREFKERFIREIRNPFYNEGDLFEEKNTPSRDAKWHEDETGIWVEYPDGHIEYQLRYEMEV